MKTTITLIIGIVLGIGLCLLGVSCGLDPHKIVPDLTWGKFSGQPVTTWRDDGRTMVLADNFVYTDPRQKVWIAPAGATIDGASIPRWAWTVVGGPYEGQYRNASIVHDVGCDQKIESSEDVHAMFYEACRCGGIPELKAKVLYGAVYYGGPSWELVRESVSREITLPDGTKRNEVVSSRRPVMRMKASVDDMAAKKLQAYIENNNPTLEQIRAFDPSRD